MSRRCPARRSRFATTFVAMLMLGLSACGNGDDVEEPSPTTPTSTPTPSAEESATEAPSESETPDEAPLSIDVSREGDRFTPHGARVEATIDEPVVLRITSDEPGELHVHTVPEQEIVYDAGTSEHEITIDRPGVVEVESHDPDLIVLQLEVR